MLGAIRAAGAASLLLTSVSAVGTGCLDRPVAPATPEVSARVLIEDKQNKVSQIDLLFMIDNSSSMADKQAILGQAVPELVKRLIKPTCVNKDGEVVDPNPVNNVCKAGVLDFEPIKDIHIGMLSSSLGSHGAGGNICDDATDGRMNPHNNDRGLLLTRNASGGNEPTFGNKGFLTYNPSTTGALQTVDQVVAPFKSMVEGVGQHGCGYEASLESVYHFLIDPEPFERITIDTSSGTPLSLPTGIDKTLLAQRAEFLRPGSLVSVMLVTDENDCSIVDKDQGFYPLLSRGGDGSVVGRGTSACLTNPNDQCCFNCNSNQLIPAGCTAPADDAECKKPPTTAAEDAVNLRCFNQKQRYGMNFLYPVQRYIDGFSKAKILNRKGELVDNPLFSDLTCKAGTACQAVRDEGLVFVAGITGVPWQLISKNPNNLLAGYKSAKDIAKEDLWINLVGRQDESTGPIAPKDPHMVESIKPRTGIPGPGSSATADPINGHDWDTSKIENQPNSDLQYACTFALPKANTCAGRDDCDCGGSDAELNAIKNPLCQDGNTFTKNQLRAKAYPGTRILQVLQGLKPEQAIVASICPANLDMTKVDAPDYGYTPAIQALLSRLRTVLRGRCLPRTLEVDEDGQVPCVIIEASKSIGGKCDCSLPGRSVADKVLINSQMTDVGDCFCQMDQITDENASDLCKTSLSPGTAAGHGWCYIDPSQGKNGQVDKRQCDLVSKCGETERRLIKYVDPTSEPRPGATSFIMCQEKAYDPKAGQAGDDVCK